MNRSSDPKLTLLNATILEIEASGIAKTTVRSIAERSRMNVASINYHFGSKTILIEAALDQSINHMMEDARAILADGSLVDLAVYLLEGAAQYPRLIQAHLEKPLRHQDYSGTFPIRFGELIGEVSDLCSKQQPECNPHDCAVALLSAIFLPALLPGLFPDLSSKDSRLRYAQSLVRPKTEP